MTGRRITEYVVIPARNAQSLAELVQQEIENHGYEPFGSVALAVDNFGNRMYAQAMVVWENE